MKSASRFFLLLIVAFPLFATDFKWNRLSGRNGWGDFSAWTPNGIPGPGDRALITDSGSYTCFLDGDFQVGTLQVGDSSSGTQTVEISRSRILTVNNPSTIGRRGNLEFLGRLRGSTVMISFGANAYLNEGTVLEGPGPLINAGNMGANTARFEGRSFDNRNMFVANNPLTFSGGAGITNVGVYEQTFLGAVLAGSNPGRFDNQGTFIASTGETSQVQMPFTNSGTVEIKAGTLSFSGGATYTQTAGKTTLNGGNLAGPITVTGGTVGGTGTITGDVSNAATMSLAGALTFGTINIQGNYTQTPAGVLLIKIGNQSQFDRLLISGLAKFAGTLSIQLVNNFRPTIGSSFPIISFGSVNGTFTTLTGLDLGDIKLVPVYSAGGLSLAAQLNRAPRRRPVRRASKCAPGSLCLVSDRFEISMEAKDLQSGASIRAVQHRTSDQSGFFTLADQTGEPEVLVKVVVGGSDDDRAWIFYGGPAAFDYMLTIEDRKSGVRRKYARAATDSCGRSDDANPALVTVINVDGSADRHAVIGDDRYETVFRDTFRSDDAGASGETSCRPSPNTLCLVGSRFEVTLEATGAGSPFIGGGLSTRHDDSFGSFSIPALTLKPWKAEVYVHLLDGGDDDGRLRLLYGGATDLDYTITIRDTRTGQVKQYTKDAAARCGTYDMALSF